MAWGGGWGGGFGLSQGLGGSFGLLLIPLTIGVCLLFALRNQRWGWFLVLASVAALAVGVLQTLIMSFQPTSLWNLLTMFALIGSGGGLMDGLSSSRNSSSMLTASPLASSSLEQPMKSSGLAALACSRCITVRAQTHKHAKNYR